MTQTPNVLVDFLPGVQGGFDRWQRQTFSAVARARTEGRLGRVSAVAYGKRFPRPAWLGSGVDYHRSWLPGRVQRFLCEKVGIPIETVFRTGQVDVVFAHVLHRLVTSRPIVLGVADVSWRQFHGQYRTTFTDAQIRLAEEAILRADHILTLSHASARDIIAGGYPSERVTVAPLAVSSEFNQVPSAAANDARERYGLPAEFVLYVGGINERKNVSILADAVHDLRPVRPLVIAGPVPPEGLGHWRLDGPLVRHLGYVPQGHLPGLYAAATVLAFPSMQEGFGLPLIEAAAVGVPVLAADIPVFREIGEGAVEYFDPHSTDGLLASLRRLFDDPNHRASVARRCQLMAENYTEGRYEAAVCEAILRNLQHKTR